MFTQEILLSIDPAMPNWNSPVTLIAEETCRIVDFLVPSLISSDPNWNTLGIILILNKYQVTAVPKWIKNCQRTRIEIDNIN